MDQEQEREQGSRQERENDKRPKPHQAQEPVDRKGTLIGAGTVAAMLGVDRRTVARWVQSGVLLVADFVDDSYAVFRREDIARVADALQQRRRMGKKDRAGGEKGESE